MAIWTSTPDLSQMADLSKKTAVNHMGIEYLEVGDDYLKGRIPVDQRTVQPFGILHGGSSVLLAETLGSMAANWCVRDKGMMAVGLEVNANHIRPTASGWVYGTASPLHLGTATQVWEIRLENEAGKLTCICRLTMAITKRH